MSLINSQVRMGRPLLADPLPFQDPGYRRMGRIHNLGVVTPPAPVVKPEEIAGLLGGTGLLVGAGFVKKGPAPIIMAILGALGVVVSGFSVLSRMMSAPAAAPTGTMTAPPPAKPGIVQQGASLVQTWAPVAQAIAPELQKLFSSSPTAPPKPMTSSSSSPAMVTSYSQLMPAPKPAPAPASQPVFVTQADLEESSGDEYSD